MAIRIRDGGKQRYLTVWNVRDENVRIPTTVFTGRNCLRFPTRNTRGWLTTKRNHSVPRLHNIYLHDTKYSYSFILPKYIIVYERARDLPARNIIMFSPSRRQVCVCVRAPRAACVRIITLRRISAHVWRCRLRSPPLLCIRNTYESVRVARYRRCASRATNP